MVSKNYKELFSIRCTGPLGRLAHCINCNKLIPRYERKLSFIYKSNNPINKSLCLECLAKIIAIEMPKENKCNECMSNILARSLKGEGEANE